MNEQDGDQDQGVCLGGPTHMHMGGVSGIQRPGGQGLPPHPGSVNAAVNERRQKPNVSLEQKIRNRFLAEPEQQRQQSWRSQQQPQQVPFEQLLKIQSLKLPDQQQTQFQPYSTVWRGTVIVKKQDHLMFRVSCRASAKQISLPKIHAEKWPNTLFLSYYPKSMLGLIQKRLNISLHTACTVDFHFTYSFEPFTTIKANTIMEPRHFGVLTLTPQKRVACPIKAILFVQKVTSQFYGIIPFNQDTFMRTLERMKQHSFWLGRVPSNVGTSMGTVMRTGMVTRTKSNPSIMPSFNHNVSTQGSAEEDTISIEFMSCYREAIRKRGAVAIKVNRAVFIGPSGAGKSSLKHLLIHNKSKVVKTSTPVVEAPDVVIVGEHYAVEEAGEGSVWKLVTGDCLKQSVKCCTVDKLYKKCKEYPTVIAQSEPNLEDLVVSGDTESDSPPDEPSHQWGNTTPDNTEVGSLLEEARSKLLQKVGIPEDQIHLDKANFLHLIDSGGQPAFQDVLPLLLAIPCTYVQVFNASKDLEDPVQSTYRPREGEEFTIQGPAETQWDFLQRSLSSMQTMAYKFSSRSCELFRGTWPEFRVIIAGTFKDEASDPHRSKIQDKMEDLRGKPYFKHIQWDLQGKIFLVDNLVTLHRSKAEAGDDRRYLNHLRKCVTDDSAAVKLDVPLMWFLLELITQNLEKKFIKEDELKHFCEKHCYIDKDKSDDQFRCLLNLLHVLGFYAHFDLDLQYLKDGTNYVCTNATALYSEVSKILAFQYSPAQQGITKEFQSTGLITSPYIALFKELHISPDIDPVWFLEVLHHLGIAARLSLGPLCSPPSYFIPSSLPYGKATVPSYSSVSPLCITFIFERDPFNTYCDLPRSVFCRLVVELADREWRVIPQESDRTSIKFSCPKTSTCVYLMEKPGHVRCQIILNEPFPLHSLGDETRLQEIHRHCFAIRSRVEDNFHHITQEIFGVKFQEIAQIRPVSSCSCQSGLHYTAPIENGVATCCHCGLPQSLSPLQKVWFSPPTATEARVCLSKQDGVSFWKLEELPMYSNSTFNSDSYSTEITSDSVLLPIKRCPNCGYEGTPEKKQLHSESSGTSVNDQASSSDNRYQDEFQDKCPSDVGISGTVEEIPEWWDLAVELGVPIPKVRSYRMDAALGSKRALEYWRNGRCGGEFPTTWRFLLNTVKDRFGPRVAQQLKDRAESDATWSN